MKIKDYTCKCGNSDFFFADKGSQKGLYCTYCGKWLKWADKDEQNLSMRPEPNKEEERATCHWISGKYRDTCSECRHTYPKKMGLMNYCPACGKKIIESEETS